MSATPLMAQFHKIKNDHPDTILLFRVGDFFETFEEDAKTASRVLGITLTKRANGKAGQVPLAGFPHHAIDNYLPKLVKAGYRVAVCEQVENPKFAKGIVKREVVEVVTPGVVFSDKLLEHKKNNYLASVYLDENSAGISYCDISTGEFFTFETSILKIPEQIETISPAEIIVSKKQRSEIEVLLERQKLKIKVTKIDDWIYNDEYAKDTLKEHFKTKTLKGFGIDKLSSGIISAGSILHYLNDTQRSNLAHITKISLHNPSEYMYLDLSTKRNLEILYTIQEGQSEGSLFSVLDKTKTSMGARLLKKWINAPLRNKEQIEKRLQCVEDFTSNKNLRNNLQNEFKEIGDLERLVSKVCTNRANPRELVYLKNSIRKIPLVKQLLDQSNSEVLRVINTKLLDLDEVFDKVELAIVDEPPISLNDGGIIKAGFSPELDELRDLSLNAKNWIANLQKTERERANIPSLKVSYNKIFGYYIEISNTHKNKIPDNYIRKQTLVNSERYITPELKEYEDRILNAEENISNLEYRLFNEVRLAIANEAEKIQKNAQLIGMLDCYLSLAECASSYNYIKPEITDSEEIVITAKSTSSCRTNITCRR
jgi:DNA mismatch repair protein MutS